MRDNGVVISPTLDLANSEFTFVAQLAGQITCDVVQADKLLGILLKRCVPWQVLLLIALTLALFPIRIRWVSMLIRRQN